MIIVGDALGDADTDAVVDADAVLEVLPLVEGVPLRVVSAVGVREPDGEPVSVRDGERVWLDVRLGVRERDWLIVGDADGVPDERPS